MTYNGTVDSHIKYKTNTPSKLQHSAVRDNMPIDNRRKRTNIARDVIRRITNIQTPVTWPFTKSTETSTVPWNY